MSRQLGQNRIQLGPQMAGLRSSSGPERERWKDAFAQGIDGRPAGKAAIKLLDERWAVT